MLFVDIAKFVLRSLAALGHVIIRGFGTGRYFGGKMKVAHFNRLFSDMARSISNSSFEIVNIDEPRPLPQARRRILHFMR